MTQLIGFGTYPLQGPTCTKAVQTALDAGYRIIDTATFYQNYTAIAAALPRKMRSDIYLTSKVWHDKQSPKDLINDCNQALDALKTDYLDAYLLHWPNHTIPIHATLSTMQKLQQQNKIRHIGMSNVTVHHLKKAQKTGIKIDCVQIEMSPSFYDPQLLQYCQEHNITLQAWRPLNKGAVFENSLVCELAQKYNRPPPQIALRWITQHGCIPLPGSTNPDHIRDNLDCTTFTLSAQDMQLIDQQALHGARYRMTLDRGLGFSDEFDFTYAECWPA